MGNKKAEDIDIVVDDLALSLVGWQVEDAQARLVTESHDSTDHEQQVAFSGTFRFLSEDWTDRFKRSDSDDYAAQIYLTLNRRDAPAPTSNYEWVVLEKIKKAQKGLIRVAAKSDTWTCRAPFTAADIDLRLTAYDLADVSGVYINSRLNLPGPTRALDIAVVDEASVAGPRAKLAAAHAYVTNDEATLTMHIEGTFEFGSADDLLRAHVEQREWVDRRSTLQEAAPFEVTAPDVRFEIEDETGFLLGDRTCRFYGRIPVNDQGAVPRRQPRWVARDVIKISKLPGDPHRVVARVIDGD
jgi:hypothetical protein